MIYWQHDKSQHKHQITGTSKTCRFGLFCAAVRASAAAAAASTAAAASAGSAGFEQGANCQKYNSGKNTQNNDVTHDSYLLRKLHMIYCKTIQLFACFNLIALA